MLERKRARKKKLRHDESDGNWLISYADLMTLLWGFFVIIAAFSIPNLDQIEKLKKSTAISMGGAYENPFNELTDRLHSILEKMNLDSQTNIEYIANGIKLTIKGNSFFESGSVTLNNEAEGILKRIGLTLKQTSIRFRVIVEGHTDDVPIVNNKNYSNWELSSMRASTVVRLFENIGIKHKQLRPVGFADLSPLIDIIGLKGEQLEKARSSNRRIVIRLQKDHIPRFNETSIENLQGD